MSLMPIQRVETKFYIESASRYNLYLSLSLSLAGLAYRQSTKGCNFAEPAEPEYVRRRPVGEDESYI